MKHYRTLIIILAVVLIAGWIALPNNPGIHFLGINREIKTHLGLDLVGGVQVLMEADLPVGENVDSNSMDTAATIVENRVNGLGVTEALVQRAGDRYIVVEIPGISDPETAIGTIKETALLEFVDMSVLPVEQTIGLIGQVVETDYAPDSGDEEAPTDETAASPLPVFHTVMTGAAIKQVGVTANEAGGYQVAFELNPEGSEVFAEFTTAHVGDILAIVLDKEVISAPRIDSAITQGSGVITGQFTADEANHLAVQLRYGALPIPLKVVETRNVGASLGEDSLQKSLVAGIIGFSVVMLFMALYYRLPGVLANISILIYALIAFALFRYIPVTLTLPGIAGFLLSTGAALDANILIFERLKEELRNGRPMVQAVDLAWKRAWPSIRDSNFATIITSLILFWFGSAFGATIVKGFSLTLALGVGISLFTAILVTRTFLALALNMFKPAEPARWFGL